MMKNEIMPLVSVIVPVYNGEKSIGECLDSILSQVYDNMEIIVVDDGSKDSTAAVVEGKAKKDSRIKLLQKPNGGVSSARNMGLDHCNGKYVRFVDSDDVLLPDSVFAMALRAERDGSDMVITPYVEKVGSISSVKDLGKRNDCVTGEEYLELLQKKSSSFYYGVLWNKLLRRELIEKEKCRFEESLNWSEDFVFLCDFISGDVNRISYLDKPTYVYQRNMKGLTGHLFINAIKHPVAGVKMRFTIYKRYKHLFIARGLYQKYKHKLWHYYAHFAVNE